MLIRLVAVLNTTWKPGRCFNQALLFANDIVKIAPSHKYRHRILMPFVKVKENEPFDIALRRFKRSCEKAGVLAEVRKREFYEKPTSIRKRKAAAAVKRYAKKVQRESRKLERLY